MSLLITAVLPHVVSPYLALCLVYYAIYPLSRQLSSIAASSSSKVNVLMQHSVLLCQCAATLMNLYILKSVVQRMVFLALIIVKYMKKKIDIMKPPYSEYILSSPLPFIILTEVDSTVYSPQKENLTPW